METLHYLFSHALKYVMILAVVIFFFFIGRLIAPSIPPEYHLKNLFDFRSKEAKQASNQPNTEFFLPTPGSLALRKVETPTTETNVYVSNSAYTPGAPYNGYQNGTPVNWPSGAINNDYTYSSYSYSSASSGDDPVFDATQAGFSSMSAYLRSISLARGSYVYQNLLFGGEAREAMFIDGKFSLYIINGRGQVIGRGVATALDQWAIPGWHRFTGRILTAIPPNQQNCALVFQQDKPSGLHMIMPASCG